MPCAECRYAQCRYAECLGAVLKVVRLAVPTVAHHMILKLEPIKGSWKFYRKDGYLVKHGMSA